MSLSEKELEQLSTVIELAVQKVHEDKCEFCMSAERRQQHRIDHEFIHSLNATLDKFSSIKWTVLRNLLSALVIAGTLAAIAYFWTQVKN